MSCLEEEALLGISVLGSQGGYIDIPAFEPGSQYAPFSNQLDFLGNPIPYWYYVSSNGVQKEQVPKKSDMEKQYKAPRFLLQLFNETAKEDMNYIYRGFFTQKITDSILELTERNLEGVGDPTKIKRRVYFIMVESLQNVTRYQSHEGVSLEESAIFGIQKKGTNYLITTGNLIDNAKIPYVRGQLERVNSLDKGELKAYYKEILKNGKFTNEGGAGLGLIEMARKSGNKLSFDFRKLNDDFSYFYLHTIIPSLSGQQIDNESYDDTLAPMVDLHQEFNTNDVLLVFNSGFSQENLLNLLNVIEKQISHLETLCVYTLN